MNKDIETFQTKLKEEIKNLLRKVGIQEGDVVLVHSDVTPVLQSAKFDNLFDAMDFVKSCFIDSLDIQKGTLVVPTFNYDFCQGKPYSHTESLSQVGLFTNHILVDEQAVRSLHPIFSFAAIGAKARLICDDVSCSSFGKNSVFDKLYGMNAKLIFFNASINSCTFSHYIEQKIGVSYRYLKEFTGKVKVDGKEFVETYDFYVRDLNQDVVLNLNELEKDLISEGRMKKEMLLGRYPILQVSCRDMFQTASEKLGRNPFYLLDHSPLARASS